MSLNLRVNNKYYAYPQLVIKHHVAFFTSLFQFTSSLPPHPASNGMGRRIRGKKRKTVGWAKNSLINETK